MNSQSVAQTNHSLARETARGTSSWSLAQLFRNWKTRRRIARLQDFDDRLLDDIGVTRAELHWATSQPLSVNAAMSLEDRAYRRRKSERHMWL